MSGGDRITCQCGVQIDLEETPQGGFRALAIDYSLFPGQPQPRPQIMGWIDEQSTNRPTEQLRLF